MEWFEEESRRLEGGPGNRRPPRRPRNGDGNGDGNGPSGPIYNPNLNIVGIEATQAIQFFNFNGQGSGAVAEPQRTTVCYLWPKRLPYSASTSIAEATQIFLSRLP
jgi:hypothetical protein